MLGLRWSATSAQLTQTSPSASRLHLTKSKRTSCSSPRRLPSARRRYTFCTRNKKLSHRWQPLSALISNATCSKRPTFLKMWLTRPIVARRPRTPVSSARPYRPTACARNLMTREPRLWPEWWKFKRCLEYPPTTWTPSNNHWKPQAALRETCSKKPCEWTTELERQLPQAEYGRSTTDNNNTSHRQASYKPNCAKLSRIMLRELSFYEWDKSLLKRVFISPPPSFICQRGSLICNNKRRLSISINS